MNDYEDDKTEQWSDDACYGLWCLADKAGGVRTLCVGGSMSGIRLPQISMILCWPGICWGMTSSSIPKGRDSDCRCLYGLYVFEESGKRGRYVRCLYLAARILKQDLCFDGYSAMS